MKTGAMMLATACVCTLVAVAQPADPLPCVFDGQDARSAKRTADWQPGSWKAECGASQALLGVSMALKDGNAHAALCSADQRAYATTGEPKNLVFSGGDSRDAQSPDWDQGYYKGECGAHEFVVGVSQTLDHKMTSILCARSKAGLARKDCKTQVFAGRDSREPGGSRPDWDPGFYKGECGAGRYVAGVSRDMKNGRPHAIYCCGR
jgi:hypothetical protein